MWDYQSWMVFFGLVALTAPASLVCVFGLATLANRPLSERAIGVICEAAILAGLFAVVSVFVLMLIDGTRQVSIEVGEWVVIPHYHFSIKLIFDRLSVPFIILTFLLCGVVAAFATRYMHRERGFNRFFVLYAVFLLGMVLTAVAGTIETLFTGWELVGLSSALLVAYFQDRPAPARNGLRVWVVYRISDAALLLSAVVLHHLRGAGDFQQQLGMRPWPESHASITGNAAILVGLLIIVAAAGKSALVPFSGWLPRAMEGPTPSSAIFYGALSVHLGAYLLLRTSPILETSVFLSVIIVSLGLSTALYAYVVGAVQTDIKSALCFASLVQVGLIVAEIGLGFRYIALIHLLGNACLRTLQFMRAPSLLHDYHLLENALGQRLPPPRNRLAAFSVRIRLWIYRFAIERGYLDSLLNEFVAYPFRRLFLWFDSLERRWTQLLSGAAVNKERGARPTIARFEDVP